MKPAVLPTIDENEDLVNASTLSSSRWHGLNASASKALLKASSKRKRRRRKTKAQAQRERAQPAFRGAVNYTTEQIEEILSALWKAIGSPSKPFLKHLASFVADVASANTVETRDQELEIISRYLRHPETFEQSSDAVRFISMLHEGSISTINEVKALLDSALSVQVLAVVAEDDVNVPAQVQDSGDMPTSIPMQIDNLGQDSDSDPKSISHSPSDASSDKSLSDGIDPSVEAMTGVGPVL